VTTHTLALPQAMRPSALDGAVGDGVLFIEYEARSLSGVAPLAFWTRTDDQSCTRPHNARKDRKKQKVCLRKEKLLGIRVPVSQYFFFHVSGV
jgi:hypothetical protein